MATPTCACSTCSNLLWIDTPTTDVFRRTLDLYTSDEEPVNSSAETTAHTNVPPSTQRSAEGEKEGLGEALYPLVVDLLGDESSRAPKITGMLLELDNDEIQHLLGSTDALRMKIDEAKQVLAAAFPSSTPQHSTAVEEKQRLGEVLYPLVMDLLGDESSRAGKITGMLLELGNDEIQHLLGSTDALRMRVDEAKHVLMLAMEATPVDPLEELSQWGRLRRVAKKKKTRRN